MKLAGDLKLADGNTLLASTQNGETFNVIAEGYDSKYPTTMPDVCCNFIKETRLNGLNTVDTANKVLTGTGTIGEIFSSSGTNGSVIKIITIKALQSTNEGMVRLFIGPDATHYCLMQEIYVPQTVQSAFEPAFKQVI